jgi:hypothetical protein
VLVDWQRDAAAGGCLLRPALVRRLLALHAAADTTHACEVRVRATGRMVTSLSPGHARLVARLEQPPELHLRLRFDGPGGAYLGGDETYQVGSSVLLRLTARIRSRAEPPPVSART